MSEIFLIGVDSCGLRKEQLAYLHESQAIVASTRLANHLDSENISARIIPITPLKEAFSAIAESLTAGRVSVLASGDPLFFGIGHRLITHFGPERVQVFPALSSLQEATSRFKMSWSDGVVVSLHGRKNDNLAALLLANPKTFVFTDGLNTPQNIAAKLLTYLHNIGDERMIHGVRMHVAENIGMTDEKISSGSLEEMSRTHFSDLNVVCLTISDLPERPTFGLTEDDVVHSRGLITKNEVRAASLHRLALPRTGILWDIGGGSGSISMEAAAMHPGLSVYTVERKEEEFQNIVANIRQFGLFNITPVKGMAGEHMAHLPTPDRVFIGGSGGELENIITTAANRLSQKGRIVVNAVTEKTRSQAPRFMEKLGMQVEITRMEIRRTGPDGSLHFNPITIMVGRK